jgi:head-tail adaptor
MRTTLTLDDDVVSKLNAEMKRSGKSFKETVNEFLRIGLSVRRELKSGDRFKVQARPLGVIPGLNYDCTGELLEEAEGPFHR